MLGSTRGAARVSAVWMISVGVVALAALAFGFIAQGEVSAKIEEAEAAREARAETEARFTEANENRRNVSEVLGWYDRQSADPISDVEAARKALADLRSTFPDLTETDEDFESALPKIEAAYERRGTEIETLKSQVAALQSEATAAQQSVAQITQAKDQTIADLRSQLADEQQNSSQRQSELEDRIDSISQELSDRDAELRDVRDRMAEVERGFAQQKRFSEARIASLNEVAAFQKEEFARQPDGKILEVSSVLPMAWINIGANQRVARGMRFQVESGTPGRSHLKAWAEVTSVKPNSAEVAIQDVVDPLDPVVVGDVIINELYDPVGGRNAVLAGSFTGTYSRQEIVALLENLGVNVQEDIDATTHFLIVGSALYNDPETSEPLGEPLPVSELPVYKQAEAQGVLIVPIENIRHFFRLGA